MHFKNVHSKILGVMHACGHDFHATVILGAALFLKKKQIYIEELNQAIGENRLAHEKSR
nr:hypothetical protein [Niallia nealsonii]